MSESAASKVSMKDWVKSHKIGVGALAAFFFIFTVDILWNGLGFIRRFDTVFRAWAPFWFILLTFFIVSYGIFARRGLKAVKEHSEALANRDKNNRRGSSYSFSSTETFSKKLSIFASATIPAHIIFGVGFVIALIYMFAVQNYITYHAYSQRAQVTESVSTSYNDRAPWVVANSYAARDQGDNVGSRGDVNHVPVPGGESSRYTTIITGRGFMGMTGYDSVREFDLPKVGTIPQTASSTCNMPTSMDKRWDTFWPTRSLERELSFKAPLSHWSMEDLYGYCKDKKPVVVLPLWKYEGFWTVTKVAAGAAVYDESGLRVLSPKELVAEKIEGPTYPGSLVKTEREALTAMGSIGDWYANRSGYELTNKDDNDANIANNSDFTLVGTDNKLYYTTPLTPRGTAQNIVALMVAPAQQIPGSNNGKYRIETSVNLPATSTIENNLRSVSVSGDNDWTTRWAAGMKVYEIVPNKNGHWSASIGLGQVVNYRADIAPDGSVSVTRTDGGVPSKKPEDTVTVQGGKPLSEMSKEELARLIKSATDELAKR